MGCGESENILKKDPETIFDDPKLDRAFGCVVGAFCGDAAGGPLEFSPVFNDEAIKNAIEMKGGGKLHLGPGQITDDSELSLCLAWGLFHSKTVLDLEKIAFWYRSWLDSPPFGKT